MKLHVPAITKNLASVSGFSSDNSVYFEFRSQSCYVKDQATQVTLLEGTRVNGIYAFPN